MLIAVYTYICFFDRTGLMGVPKRNGKLKDLAQFDAGFFGVHPKQATHMDPQLRMLLEISYEAIVDAGSYIYLHIIIKIT